MLPDEFEWDDAKSAANRAKHGVDFHEAIRVFLDPAAFEFPDERRDYGEDRWIICGRVGSSLLVLQVAYTDRGDRVRIISARQADPYLIARYWAGT